MLVGEAPRMIATTTLRLALTAVLSAVLAAQERGPWVVGRPLPALRLPTIDGGKTIDLSTLRGSRLLLIEFASW